MIEPLLFNDRFHAWTALLILPCYGRTVSHAAPTAPQLFQLSWLCAPVQVFFLRYSAHNCSLGIKSICEYASMTAYTVIIACLVTRLPLLVQLGRTGQHPIYHRPIRISECHICHWNVIQDYCIRYSH